MVAKRGACAFFRLGVRMALSSVRPVPKTPPLSAPTPSGPGSDGAVAAERYVIPNLRNACRVLKALGRQSEGLKVSDLARELAIPVTTTLRIMTTLHAEGLVRKQDGRYELGPVLIQLGTAALSGTEVRELALPLLQKLTALTDETSHLALPCDGRALIVASTTVRIRCGQRPARASSPNSTARRPGRSSFRTCTTTRLPACSRATRPPGTRARH